MDEERPVEEEYAASPGGCEIELKYRFDHGRRGGVVYEDRYYEFVEGRVLRLRIGGGRAWLTAKAGERCDADCIVTRLEREVECDPRVLSVFELAGLRPVVVVRKRRLMEKLHDCVVCYDEVEGLGRFVEVEGAPQNIRRVAETLGLEEQGAVPVRESYYAMLKSRMSGKREVDLG